MKIQTRYTKVLSNHDGVLTKVIVSLGLGAVFFAREEKDQSQIVGLSLGDYEEAHKFIKQALKQEEGD